MISAGHDSVIWFCGDVHGEIRHLVRMAERVRPHAVVLLGDLETPVSLDEWFAPLVAMGVTVRFIHGNHDCGRSESWDNIRNSRAWEWNLDGKVETVGGVRIAGLGGIFRGRVWNGIAEPSFGSYAAWEASLAPAWMPEHDKRQKAALFASQRLTHSSTIFPATIDTLAALEADVLVTHEAPSMHKHGMAVIDDLAAAMGVKRLFFGHHHERAVFPKTGSFEAFGVGYREIVGLDGDLIFSPTGPDEYVPR